MMKLPTTRLPINSNLKLLLLEINSISAAQVAVSVGVIRNNLLIVAKLNLLYIC